MEFFLQQTVNGLTLGSVYALLALGSREEGFFSAGQGTELLGFVARVLENCFRGWLNLACA